MIHLESRLIAMLDVLGFAERIKTRQGLVQSTAQYAKFIAQAKEHMFAPKPVKGSPEAPKSNFEHGQFVFDTLVLVSYPIDTKSTFNFIFATILLLEKFFASQFPLRGAICLGDFTIDQTEQIFLSDSFKRLSSEGSNQNWSGCTVLEEAEDIVVSSLLGTASGDATRATLLRSSPIHRMSVPLKSPPTSDLKRWCLNWSYFLSPRSLQNGVNYMQGSKDKRDNTEMYLKKITALQDDCQLLPP